MLRWAPNSVLACGHCQCQQGRARAAFSIAGFESVQGNHMSSSLRRGLPLCTFIGAAMLLAACEWAPQAPLPSAVNSADVLLGKPYSGRSEPTPRDADGHPSLTGYWKLLREAGKPDGNLGKDLPAFALPHSEAGKKALSYNLTR